tara:strand:- start:1843 stop:2130 length:288 start_codon:yes stop_codon:yes gene_type:complete
MSSLEDQLLPQRPRVPVQTIAGGCIGAMLFIQFILICAMVATVGIIAPELKSVLHDVNTMLPQMHKSIEILGTLLPDIKEGLGDLDHICQVTPGC